MCWLTVALSSSFVQLEDFLGDCRGVECCPRATTDLAGRCCLDASNSSCLSLSLRAGIADERVGRRPAEEIRCGCDTHNDDLGADVTRLSPGSSAFWRDASGNRAPLIEALRRILFSSLLFIHALNCNYFAYMTVARDSAGQRGTAREMHP